MSVKIKYKLDINVKNINTLNKNAFECTAGKTPPCASFKGRRNVLNTSEKECVKESFSVPVQGAISKQALEGLQRNDWTSGGAPGWKKLKVRLGESRWRIADFFHRGGAGLQEEKPALKLEARRGKEVETLSPAKHRCCC